MFYVQVLGIKGTLHSPCIFVHLKNISSQSSRVWNGLKITDLNCSCFLYIRKWNYLIPSELLAWRRDYLCRIQNHFYLRQSVVHLVLLHLKNIWVITMFFVESLATVLVGLDFTARSHTDISLFILFIPQARRGILSSLQR